MPVTLLNTLTIPTGMMLPTHNQEYEIPLVLKQKILNKNLYIWQSLQLITSRYGYQSPFNGNDIAMSLEQLVYSSDLWHKVATVVQKNSYSIASKQDDKQTITTDWILWHETNKNQHYSCKYQINLSIQGYQTLLKVTVLGIRQKSLTVNNPAIIKHYTMKMVKTIIKGLQQFHDDNNLNQVIQSKTANINVQSSTNENELPHLILNSPYETVWLYLPTALSYMGMTVNNSCYPLGTISLKYNISRSHLGIKKTTLLNGNYKIQVGDLNNQSSLQLIDSKGKFLTKSQNDALVAVFQSAFNLIKNY